MKRVLSRRSSIKAAATAASVFTLGDFTSAGAAERKGNINHSVCRWCYGKIPLEDLCKAAKEMGISSVELIGPDEWDTAKKYGLTCAMANGAGGPGMGIERGWNRREHHAQLIKSYEEVIPLVAKAGLTNLICFSGNRAGQSDEEGIKICAEGLKKLMPTAEKHKVTVVMELLNSKVNHRDYQCDKTPWGVELCKAVGSERFKLLYDIYHMQIMEGDLARTIAEHLPQIAHIQLADNPGRNEPGTGEINYDFLFRHLDAIGYQGWIGCEYKPKTTTVEGLGWVTPYL